MCGILGTIFNGKKKFNKNLFESSLDLLNSRGPDFSKIDKFIGKDYSRVRIGIGRPDPKISISDFVLMNFNEDEIERMNLITQNIVDSISMLLDKKLELFSSTVNNK